MDSQPAPAMPRYEFDRGRVRPPKATILSRILRRLFYPERAHSVITGAVLSIPALIGCSAMSSSTQDTASIQSSAPVEGLDRAAVDMYVGNAKVITGATEDDQLYRAQIDYPRSFTAPSVSFDTGQRTLQIRQSERSRTPDSRHVYRLDLSPKVGWSSYQVHGGGLEAALDFRPLRLSRLTVFAGDVNLDVSLPRPQNAVQIEVTGGSNVTSVIRVPSGVDVQVTGNGRSTTIDAFGSQSKGSGGVTWQSPGYGGATNPVSVFVNGNNVTVRLATD